MFIMVVMFYVYNLKCMFFKDFKINYFNISYCIIKLLKNKFTINAESIVLFLN